MWGAQNLTVRFGGGHGPAATEAVTALDAVTVAVPAGAVTAIVGGDGAGKSTLLRAFLGRVPTASGAVTMPGLERIGYQPSSSGVWRALSVAENVEFVGAAYGMAGATLTTRRDELLARAGLDGALDRLGGQLSGGMRQKLGFCLAMLHRPEVLLLDEPSTGVDPVSRVELWRLVAEAAAAGTAVCMTTTYLDEAERASTVIALDSGRVLAAGEPAVIRGAVPGTVSTNPTRPADAAGRAWRRGTLFHVWTPPAGAPAGAAAVVPGAPVEPDLEDAVIALTLARQGGRPEEAA